MAAVHIKTGTSTLICTANQWTGFYDKDLHHERVNIEKFNYNHSFTFGKITIFFIWKKDDSLLYTKTAVTRLSAILSSSQSTFYHFIQVTFTDFVSLNPIF